MHLTISYDVHMKGQAADLSKALTIIFPISELDLLQVVLLRGRPTLPMKLCNLRLVATVLPST